MGALLACTVLLIALLCLRRRCTGRYRAGYTGLRAGGGNGRMCRVCFELGDGLREYGDVSLAGTSSVKDVRTRLLELSDELLLDPDDDLREWTLRYTDRAGVLLPVTSSLPIAKLQADAQELRVTAGPPLGLAQHEDTSTPHSSRIPLRARQTPGSKLSART